MKDYIQQASGEVAIVIYDAPLPPKYFRLTKRFIHTLFVVIPILLVLSFVALFFWGLGSRLKEAPRPQFPKVITEQENKVSNLEAEVKNLKDSNDALATKIATQPGTQAAEDPYLSVIKKPYGMQNLISSNKVTLDQFDLVQTNNKITLKFQIISTDPETKVSGNVLVLMMSEGGIMAYPPEANITMGQGIKYSLGEPFAVQRLRPTNAEFLHRPVGPSLKFMIYIFSREGDLLLIKETESFKVEVKS